MKFGENWQKSVKMSKKEAKICEILKKK